MKIGYIRVSSSDQNPDRQIKQLKNKGVDKLYIDKISGKDTNRPQLQEMLEYIREGDIVCFVSISRLARNTKDFLEMMELFKTKGVGAISLKEPIDTTTPQGKMIATIFASMYEMERESIRERQREGIEVARDRGVQFGRPKIKISDRFTKIYNRWKAGDMTATQAMKTVEMSSSTFYRRVKEYEENLNKARRGS